MRKTWKHTTPPGVQDEPHDNNSPYVLQQVTRFHETGRLIHPESAMEIAAWWHGPMNPGFTAFSHTGTITPELLDEIAAEMPGEHEADNHQMIADTRDLEALAAYVRAATRIEPVITYSEGTFNPRPSCVRDATGRVRVWDPAGDRYGYATLADVQWD